jgi:hypothetical protein
MAAIGTRKLVLTIDGEDVTTEVSSAVITSKEAKTDFVSFAQAAAGGGREYALKLKFVQDADSASLWSKIWAAAGTDVPIVIKPQGAVAASASSPWFSGTATVTEPDGDFLGGDADASTSARFVTEAEWIFLAKPTKVVT